MASRIQIRFNIGSVREGGDATNPQLLEHMVNAIGEEAVDLVKAAERVRLGALAKRLEQTVATEYADGIRYAASNLIGLSSKGQGDAMRIFIQPPGADDSVGFTTRNNVKLRMKTPKHLKSEMYWKTLKKRTVIDKMRRNGGNKVEAHRFFLNTGALRRSLLAGARAMVKRTGAVSVIYREAKYRLGGRFAKITKSPEKVVLGDIRINLLPKIPKGLLRGLQTGNIGDTDPSMGFERALGISGLRLQKLMGPAYADPSGKSNRPLLQPVFTYWTLFRMPNRIANALNRAMTNGET